MRRILIAALVVLAGCGGTSVEAEAPTTSASTTTTVDPTIAEAAEMVEEATSLIREFGRQYRYGRSSDAKIAEDRASESCEKLADAVKLLPEYQPKGELGLISVSCLRVSLQGLALSQGKPLTDVSDEVAKDIEDFWGLYVADRQRD